MQLPFPFAPEPDDISRETGRLLFARGSDFLKGVVAMSGLPPADRIEVCFAGRSNVGKSSLINALTGRKGLARASNTQERNTGLDASVRGATRATGFSARVARLARFFGGEEKDARRRNARRGARDAKTRRLCVRRVFKKRV